VQTLNGMVLKLSSALLAVVLYSFSNTSIQGVFMLWSGA